MITLTIDNQTVRVDEGTTLLEAARKLSIHIPTLCYADGYTPTTSCMVCVVKVNGLKSLVPSCATKAAEGMVVTTCDKDVQQARKTAVELLLSEHVGDCVGPCERGCPANMNIPLMIRQIADGDFASAIATVKRDIALPAVLGRICPAPCEKVCRRAQADTGVAICLLKRFAADVDLASDVPYQPACRPSIGKRAVIVGAGPCGLSAAWHLAQAGIACTLIDEQEYPGGSLRYGDTDRSKLPMEVLEQEIEQIFRLGVVFQPNTRLGKNLSLDELCANYDAVLLATGELTDAQAGLFAAFVKDNKIQVSRPEYATSQTGVFAAGACIGSRNLTIRAVADGKEAADAIHSWLMGRKCTLPKAYNHMMGRLQDAEMAVFLQQADERGRIEPDTDTAGFSADQARAEALRCLHCDCRKADCCGLRDAATALEARRTVWPNQRGLFEQIKAHERVIYEPGKCIKCGLCVQTARQYGEAVGLSFEGRGFAMRIAAPLTKTLDLALTTAADACVKNCPTGALAYNETIYDQTSGDD